MSTVTATGGSPIQTRRNQHLWLKISGFVVILAFVVFFVAKYVFHYYLNYNEKTFTDPIAGAANYWTMRGWLLMHISGGMVAALTGPWQFWTGFRSRFYRVHRWMGRIFLGSVAVGAAGAFHLAVSTTFGWAFGLALIVMASAWVTSAAIAWYAILKRRVAIHKVWMVRAYVVTFGFVVFRIFNDYGPTSHLQPDGDRGVAAAWVCWVVPMMIVEVIQQLRKLQAPPTLS
jgi:uncharacterized membrane protein YozB (DUF420 family)